MNVKNIGLVFMVVILASCTGKQKMPDAHYTGFAQLNALMNTCYSYQFMEVDLYVAARQAYQILLNSWDYDAPRLNDQAYRMNKVANANYANCRKVEGEARKIITEANALQRSQQARKTDWAAIANALEAFNKASAPSTNAMTEQSNAMFEQSMQMLNQQQPGFSSGSGFKPQPFYPAGSCLGTVVNGICQGTVNPSARQQCCHGTIINGECKGTVGPC